MHFLVLTFCLIKFAQASVSFENYKIIRVNLEVPDTHKEFDDNSQLTSLSTKMVNGQRATEGQFPWAAYMNIRSAGQSYSCSSAILSSRFVLSAYHCIEK